MTSAQPLILDYVCMGEYMKNFILTFYRAQPLTYIDEDMGNQRRLPRVEWNDFQPDIKRFVQYKPEPRFCRMLRHIGNKILFFYPIRRPSRKWNFNRECLCVHLFIYT